MLPRLSLRAQFPKGVPPSLAELGCSLLHLRCTSPIQTDDALGVTLCDFSRVQCDPTDKVFRISQIKRKIGFPDNTVKTKPTGLHSN